MRSDGQPAAEPQVVARVPFLAAQRGERIGIVGPNGAGKTTLLRTIAGDLPPLDGTLTFGHAAQIGYLAQLRGAAIPGTTVLDALLETIPVTAGEARAYLARFLFRGDDAFKEVRALSGGERSRLELALLGIQPSNLLLLDEPTNHLDIPAREAIEAFMRDSAATLLVVSHDRRLLETVCDRLWVVGDGAATAFDGGYKAWRQAVANGWTVAQGVEEQRVRMRPGAVASHRSFIACGRWQSVGSRRRRGEHDSCHPGRRRTSRPRTTAQEEVGEVVEGCVSAAEGGARCGADSAGIAEEPSRAGDGRSGGRGELRRDAARHERACGRRHRARRRGGCVAPAGGTRAVNPRADGIGDLCLGPRSVA